MIVCFIKVGHSACFSNFISHLMDGVTLNRGILLVCTGFYGCCMTYNLVQDWSEFLTLEVLISVIIVM